MTVYAERSINDDGNVYISIENDQEDFDAIAVGIEYDEANDLFVIDTVNVFTGEVDTSFEYTREEIVALRDAINELLEDKE